MRKIWIIATIILLGLFTYIEIWPRYGNMWHGDYKIEVHFEYEGERPIEIGCVAEGRREDCDRWIQNAFPPDAIYDEGQKPWNREFDSEPLLVNVRRNGQATALLNRDYGVVQDRFLVVIAEWADGHLEYQIVDVPDRSISKEMTVRIHRSEPAIK